LGLALHRGKLKEARYSFSEQEVKQYFTAPKVLQGLFKIIETLFEVSIREDQAPVWHPAVGFYRLERNGQLVGQFYLDPPARAGKRGGAWMDDVRARWLRPDTQQLQTPVAHLVCNFAEGVDGQPPLLTHDDVITLFHEFGHGLHHMLTQVNERDVSGISGVEWDAVELPSQFMENFCWEWNVLKHMSAHVKTGEALPRELFDKMVAAKNFQSGLQTLRQIEFALMDMLLHSEHRPQDDFMPVLQKVRAEVAVIQAPDFNRMSHTFSHILPVDMQQVITATNGRRFFQQMPTQHLRKRHKLMALLAWRQADGTVKPFWKLAAADLHWPLLWPSEAVNRL